MLLDVARGGFDDDALGYELAMPVGVERGVYGYEEICMIPPPP